MADETADPTDACCLDLVGRPPAPVADVLAEGETVGNEGAGGTKGSRL